MPARDLFHQKVIKALEKDGWKITADPYKLKWGDETLFVDLAAERVIAAEKENTKIAVEVKSFVGHSQTADLQQAIGQYVLYNLLIEQQDPERVLYLAVPDDVFYDVFEGVKGKILLRSGTIKVFGYSTEKEEIVGWKN